MIVVFIIQPREGTIILSCYCILTLSLKIADLLKHGQMSKFAVGFNVCMQCVLHQCHQLMKVFTPHLISLKQVRTWRSSFSNDRKDVNNNQQPALPSISIMDGNRFHADALFREDRCFKFNHIAPELGSFFRAAHSTARNQPGYRKMCAC